MLYLTRLLLFLFFIVSFLQAASAQAVPDTIAPAKVIVKMKNGDEYQGRIMSMGKDTVRLATENGELNLIAANVVLISEDDNTSKYPFANPHDTRYFFGPSAIPLGKGEGYYQNIYISFNSVNYGITDYLSIGGGFEFISTITGNPVWFLTPKLGFEVANKFHLGGGLLAFGASDLGAAGILYGVATYGTSESNVSAGLGYGFAFGDLDDAATTVVLSATHRVGRSIALLTENYVFVNSFGDATLLGIQGIRILGRKNAFDVGAVIIPAAVEFIPALPYVGYVRMF